MYQNLIERVCDQTLSQVVLELEELTKHEIPISRALDLIEAMAGSTEEVIAVNTLRESMIEAIA
ncbi:MAG: hypothetical protein ACI86H_000818 [bacterium]|jgi:hypothetical protein